MAVVTAPRALVAALQDERNLATTTLIGVEDAIALPVTDTAQARSATDAAVAAFEAFVAASPDGAAYQPRARRPRRPRASCAATSTPTPAPGRSNNVGVAHEVFDRYAGIVDAGCWTRRGRSPRRSTTRSCVRAPRRTRGVCSSTSRPRSSAGSPCWPRSSPGAESIGELSRLHTEVQQGLDALLAETTGTPYEEAAITVVDEIEEAGLLEATGAVLEGSADISAILAATDLPADQGWPAFLDRVEEILAAESG